MVPSTSNHTRQAFQRQNSLKNIQLGTIYDWEVPGTCVKRAGLGSSKLGVTSGIELRHKYAVKHTLAKASWPTVLHLEPESFENVKQKELDDFFDVLGILTDNKTKVTKKSITPRNGKAYDLASRTITVTRGNLELPITLLGPHAYMQMKEGQAIAFKGLHLREYNQQRAVTTTHLTIVDCEPDPAICSELPETDADAPIRKIVACKNMLPLPIQEIMHQRAALHNEYNVGNVKITEKHECCSIVQLREWDDSVFDTTPFYGAGDMPSLRFTATIYDHTGDMQKVTLWHDAVVVITGMNGSEFKSKWEACVDPDKRPELLKAMNTHLNHQFKMWITITLWQQSARSDPDESTAVTQVQVNVAEKMPLSSE